MGYVIENINDEIELEISKIMMESGFSIELKPDKDDQEENEETNEEKEDCE